MDSVDYLIVGAGVSGLSFANWIRAEAEARGKPMPSMAIIERDDAPGGYCRTVVQDGFVWDYSGHFFHFRHPDIEAWLRERMPNSDIRTVVKKTCIRHRGLDIDFPFQKNIHQLDKADFIDCLVSLYFRGDSSEPDDGSFRSMLYRRYGRGIAERFLVPYNQKLYAIGLDKLDCDAMGRFFPDADIADIIRNMQAADNASYNSTFTYPKGGAIEYIEAMLRDLPGDQLHVGEALVEVDVAAKRVRTTGREIGYRQLISSAPLPSLLAMTETEHDPAIFSSNKVLVFNLGFDRKGRDDIHWMYFPDPDVRFYRIGFYDNIHTADRMSLYVEIGAGASEELDPTAELQRVMADLTRLGVVTDHQLVSSHTVTLDPAYVHISQASVQASETLRRDLAGHGVHSVGRYGRWTYCSIEDNMVETRELAARLAGDL